VCWCFSHGCFLRFTDLMFALWFVLALCRVIIRCPFSPPPSRPILSSPHEKPTGPREYPLPRLFFSGFCVPIQCLLQLVFPSVVLKFFFFLTFGSDRLEIPRSSMTLLFPSELAKPRRSPPLVLLMRPPSFWPWGPSLCPFGASFPTLPFASPSLEFLIIFFFPP